MYAALSLVIIIAFTFLSVRVASVALKLTGMPTRDARFQALSALTGTGFTTRDSELIVNYPIRRQIISWLMILGNLGVVSVVATTLISFVNVGTELSAIIIQLAWLTGSTALFFIIMMSSFVDRIFCNVIAFVLKKYTFLGNRRHHRVLQLGDGISIGEHQFFSKDVITINDLQESMKPLKLLAIHRSNGQTEIVDSNTDTINPDDKILVLGSDEAHAEFEKTSN